MLNLLQSNMCGGNNHNTNSANGNDSHYSISSYPQQNNNSRTERVDENMKIEHSTSGDRIAFIKIPHEMTSSTSVTTSELHNRRQFHKYFLQKYPDFFRQYCMCLHRKIEPDDLNTVSCIVDDKYGANSFLFNRTPIIPITVDPKKYVIFVKCPINIM